jgi:hypothetical protein
MSRAASVRSVRRWSWAGACSIGTSHLRAGAGCDDSAACLEFMAPNGGCTLIAVVSDGAGSARLSSLGSRMVSRAFCTSAARFLAHGGHAAEVSQEVADGWLDDVRDRIDHGARQHGVTRKAFAATLVGIVAQREAAAIIHVGDGSCAVRMAGETAWRVPSWPTQGEYASTTYFVTDDPEPRTVVSSLDGTVEEVALFTDGLERLALDFGTGAAFQPFFESMFSALRGAAAAGRQRRLSRDLRTFLDGPSITDRTDDDKSLIMARRISPAAPSPLP